MSTQMIEHINWLWEQIHLRDTRIALLRARIAALELRLRDLEGYYSIAEDI